MNLIFQFYNIVISPGTSSVRRASPPCPFPSPFGHSPTLPSVSYSPTNFDTIKTDIKKACITSKGVHTRFSFPYSRPISPKMNTLQGHRSQIRIPPQQFLIPVLNQSIHRIIQPLLRRGDLPLMGNRLPLRPLLRVRVIHPPPDPRRDNLPHLFHRDIPLTGKPLK